LRFAGAEVRAAAEDADPEEEAEVVPSAGVGHRVDRDPGSNSEPIHANGNTNPCHTPHQKPRGLRGMLDRRGTCRAQAASSSSRPKVRRSEDSGHGPSFPSSIARIQCRLARWIGDTLTRRIVMTDASAIREHMDVIGADGVHIGHRRQGGGQPDQADQADSGAQMEQPRAATPGTTTTSRSASSPGSRAPGPLSATGANAVLFEEEEGD
jgi:hypothetical protein